MPVATWTVFLASVAIHVSFKRTIKFLFFYTYLFSLRQKAFVMSAEHRLGDFRMYMNGELVLNPQYKYHKIIRLGAVDKHDYSLFEGSHFRLLSILEIISIDLTCKFPFVISSR